MNLLPSLQFRAAETPDAPAILALGRSPLTFARLWSHIGHISRALAGAGLGPNDVIAAVLPDAEMLTAYLGVHPVAGFAPLNPDLREAEFESCLRTLAPQALLIPEEAASPAVQAAGSLGIPVYGTHSTPEGGAGLFTIPSLTAERGVTAPPAPSDLALLMLTSATTGRAKGVCITCSNQAEMLRAFTGALLLTSEDRFLCMMPMFHLQGLLSAAGQLWIGGSVVAAAPFDTGRFTDAIQQFHPTWYTGGPALHRSILALCRERPEVAGLLRLRLVRSIGAALSPALLHELETALRVPVVEGYGLTEAGTVTSTPLSPYACRPGSAGRRITPGLEIMDEAGNLLPPGSTGEIVLRGPNVIREYRNDPEATTAAFRNDWFRTGDLGRFDEDGYLFVTGRIKEMINRGGEKILPAEIDEALLAHPAVTDAAAFGIPHTQLGDDVAVAVVPRPGALVDEREIRDYLAPRLAAFKIPRVVLFVSGIPRGATGKAQRTRLSEQYAELHRTRAAGAALVAPSTEEERKLTDIWSAALGIPVPGIDQDFFDLGGHSLAAARVIARIEEAFGVRLRQDALLAAPTLRRLAGLLKSQERRQRNIVVIQPEGSKPAFFMVRPLSVFRPLFTRLGMNRPVVGLPLPSRRQLGGEAGWPEVARLLVSAIRDYQPSGPYCIGGWCADGVLAFEAARQLTAEGDAVELVVLFDTPCPALFKNPLRRRTWRRRWNMLLWRVRFQWASLHQLGRKEVPPYIWDRFVALFRQCAAEFRVRLLRQPAAQERLARLHHPSGIRMPMSRYECHPYSGRLTLFCAEGSRGAGYAEYPAYGWKELAEERISVHSVPGDHLTMFLEPNVETLAQLLTSELGAHDTLYPSPIPHAAAARTTL